MSQLNRVLIMKTRFICLQITGLKNWLFYVGCKLCYGVFWGDLKAVWDSCTTKDINKRFLSMISMAY